MASSSSLDRIILTPRVRHQLEFLLIGLSALYVRESTGAARLRRGTTAAGQISSQVKRMVCAEPSPGPTSEADHALPLERQAAAAYLLFLSVRDLHEGAVLALIDQHELVAAELDAGVHARDALARYHDVIVVGTADSDARVALIHQQLAVVELQTHGARRGRFAELSRRALTQALDARLVLAFYLFAQAPHVIE